MGFGVIGAIGEGSTTPLVLYLSSLIMNKMGTFSTMSIPTFLHCINKVAVSWLYLAAGTFLVNFLKGYCWTRTSERQAARMRGKYLKAVMRQEVAYFDLNVTSTFDVIISVSNDTLLIQDVISEKVPNLLVNISWFIGSYIASFAMLWRLAIVGIPFTILLIIPGFIYSKTLMGLARKMREEYNKAGAIAEQAISSIRTVYSYVGENETINAFSNALEGSMSLGIKQGLAKGLAIGSNNGIVFGIWSFMCYYGSRLVMDHGAKGGTVFSAGTAITAAGL
ncbi:ABC transporter B member 15 [Stylosanthes scabra]|uniref:ABC transporter B member 15 n=1 Tax=Stylosanthes scabra TaxID=79078 RepID=A0ABU6TI83_9FABA|nr:ABC transporter B member 15 [Stylosanthes scabra]